ncbi:UBX domain-containing protein 11-like [Argonauta hians]
MSSPFSSLKKHQRSPLPGPMRRIKLLPMPTPEDINYGAADLQGRCYHSKTSNLSLSHLKFTPDLLEQRLHKAEDKELFSFIMEKLSNAEENLMTCKEQLLAKDQIISALEERIEDLKKLVGKSREELMAELTEKSEQQQSKIREMEDFLYDYGLVWVGGAKAEKKTEPPNNLPAGKDRKDSGPRVNYDVVIANIKELNVLAGEGVSHVEHTRAGAKLKETDAASLVLYRNGIFLLNGPFRPLSDPATRRCLYDIMEGFFPTELQKAYPEGIPLHVSDYRTIDYELSNSVLFPGPGKPLNTMDTFENSNTTDQQLSMTQPQEPRIPGYTSSRVSMPDNADPKTSDDKANNPPKCRQLTIIETLVEREKQMINDPKSPDGKEIANIQVKSESGECTYLLKMNYSDTVGMLREYITNHRPVSSPPFDILSTYPRNLLGDNSATILECGLVPTATLVLEARQ